MIDQRIDDLLQLGDAGLGDAHAALAFELERLGHDADGEDAHVARGLGDDRRGAGAGAAAHAGGDEHHVRAGEMVADLVDRPPRPRRAPTSGCEPAPRPSVTCDAHLDRCARPWTWSAPARRCWRRRTRRPAGPAVIMLLTALPPAPPTPKTVIRGFSSLMSGSVRLSAMVASRLRRARWFAPAGGRGSW